ncbi:MAG: substrate-binding domain-containing protein [Acidithiobacillus ferrooxidans]
MTKSSTLRLAPLLAAASLMVFGTCAVAADNGWGAPGEFHGTKSQVFPPWQNGANNPATSKGLDFTIPEVDNLPDFHGSIDNPKLSIFVGGNYFFAMAPLVAAFEKEHPEIKGRIYYETIPPGLLIRQMEHGNTITVGNMTWTVKPDVYAAGLQKVDYYVQHGLLKGPAVPYVTNDLTIMVPKGNPAHISGLQDLGKPGMRLVMPNPAWEGIARQIKMSLTKAGGPALATAVYDTKVQNGETILTEIHHRQSPMFLMQGRAVAGVTWKSEAIFQEKIGNPIGNVAIPAQFNTKAIYAAAAVKDAPHPKWAEAWVNFLKSPTALHIFEEYGFQPYTQGK